MDPAQLGEKWKAWWKREQGLGEEMVIWWFPTPKFSRAQQPGGEGRRHKAVSTLVSVQGGARYRGAEPWCWKRVSGKEAGEARTCGDKPGKQVLLEPNEWEQFWWGCSLSALAQITEGRANGCWKALSGPACQSLPSWTSTKWSILSSPWGGRSSTLPSFPLPFCMLSSLLPFLKHSLPLHPCTCQKSQLLSSLAFFLGSSHPCRAHVLHSFEFLC